VRRSLLLALALAASLPCGEAAGQETPAAETLRTTLSGRVLDASTGAHLEGAFVEVLGSSRIAISDADGRVSMQLQPGEQTFRIRLIGYEELTTTLHLPPGTLLHEFAMNPRPVVLEAIHVVDDQIRQRRNAVPMSVFVLNRRQLLVTGGSAADIVLRRTGLVRVECPHYVLTLAPCALIRGEAQPVAVHIDDRISFAGLDELETYQPQELYMIEIYGGGRFVRAYTTRYMEYVTQHGMRTPPPLLPYW
jgi:hypothetical protein